jgi:hypothetical protein
MFITLDILQKRGVGDEDFWNYFIQKYPLGTPLIELI